MFLVLTGCRTGLAQEVSGNAKWLEPERSSLSQDKARMPFFPSRANTTHNTPLKAGDFDSATVCGTCHTEIFDQWKTSMMAQSWDEPIYRALLKMASKATEGKVDNFCTGCHTPIGLTTGQINSEVNQGKEAGTGHALPGVDCESCHNLSARTGLDNAAYVLTPMAHGKPTKFGPRHDAVSPYHDTVQSGLQRRSDFCATCHNVTHPFTSVAVERTYDEWAESPYSHNGEECQSCHMPRYKGKAAIMGPEREDVASHYFPGANATVLKHMGFDDSAQRARDLLAKAATLEWLEAPPVLGPGKAAQVKVKVANVGAGHKLPTGFPEGREIWLDFKVVDATGRTVFRLGRVRDGATEPGTRNFKVHLGDKDGHEVEIEVWNATHILSDNRLLPKGFAVEDFRFDVPADAVAPLTLTAELNYWPFPQKLVDFLLGPGRLQVEVTTMARLTRTLPFTPTLPPAGVVGGLSPADQSTGNPRQAGAPM